jgi:hypothetical protein
LLATITAPRYGQTRSPAERRRAKLSATGYEIDTGSSRRVKDVPSFPVPLAIPKGHRRHDFTIASALLIGSSLMHELSLVRGRIARDATGEQSLSVHSASEVHWLDLLYIEVFLGGAIGK